MKKVEKPNLGDSKEITERHVKERLQSKKESRKEYMEKRRKDASSQITNYVQLIQDFPFNEFLNHPCPIHIVKKLVDVLKTDKVEEHFAPSELYPEVKGPYLFKNPEIIKRLIHLLKNPNTELLRYISHCLLLIAAHEETYTWSFMLIKNDLLPITYHLLTNCPDVLVRENLIWTLTNMCLDNSNTRNAIINTGGVECVQKNFEDNVSVVCYFFKGLF